MYSAVNSDIDWDAAIRIWGEVCESEACPACGSVIDYCQGHGPIGDYEGYAVLIAHDDDDVHIYCHPDGCEVAAGASHG